MLVQSAASLVGGSSSAAEEGLESDIGQPLERTVAGLWQ